MKFDSYTIETKGIKNICKSPSAWGKRKGTNGYFPLVYFLKPKWMSNADFKQIIACIRMDFPANKNFIGSEE